MKTPSIISRKRDRLSVSIFFVLFLLSTLYPYAQEPEEGDTLLRTERYDTLHMGKSEKIVYLMEIREEIAKPVWRKVQLGFEEAQALSADLILIHMNTYGGEVSMADSIRTKILQSPIPVYVFIDNNAASAGALISIACDRIYMRPGGNIGAATVVNQEAEQMPDKYQSYMRSMMRSTAETRGRDPQIAQAMVDPDVEVTGISEKGKVLTFTTREAITHGFCDGEATTYREVIRNYSPVPEAEIVIQELSLIDRIIGLLISPIVSGLLIMVIVGGIYFEFQTPGMGFPSLAALTAAIIYFAPLYLEGLAANWEIALFVVGVILVMVEVFALPGFGIAGIGGVFSILTSLTFSMVRNEGFSFSPTEGAHLLTSFLVVIIATVAALITSFFLARKMFTSRKWNLALHTVLNKEEGFRSTPAETNQMTGKVGTTYTVLRPGGKIAINGEIYDAIAENRFIEKGKPIIITRCNNAQLFVKEQTKNNH